jgi:tetratricopeptide (TPR) repeat protein
MAASLLLMLRESSAQSDLPFVSPPRTIADITAILDQQRPDPKAAAKVREQADRPTPANADAFELVRFYYDRGLARSLLGRYQDALTDAEKALEAAKGRLELGQVARLRQFQALQYVYMGDPKRARDVFLAMAREVDRPGVKGWLFNTYRWISWNLLRFGDVDREQGPICARRRH